MAMLTGANLPAITDEMLEAARRADIKKISTGRPSTFNIKTAAEICRRIEAGESLKKICNDKHMPVRSTVNDWRRFSPQFAASFAQARLNQGAALVDDALEILSDTVNAKSLTEIRSAEIRAKFNFELSKCYDRDTYGDKQQINQTVNVSHTVGGIIELISGKAAPLVCLGEVEEAQLIP